MSYDAFSPNLKQMYSKIRLIKRRFVLIKRVFYYRNKWSNSGRDNFGLIKRVGLLTVGLNKQGLLYYYYCIINAQLNHASNLR